MPIAASGAISVREGGGDGGWVLFTNKWPTLLNFSIHLGGDPRCDNEGRACRESSFNIFKMLEFCARYHLESIERCANSNNGSNNNDNNINNINNVSKKKPKAISPEALFFIIIIVIIISFSSVFFSSSPSSPDNMPMGTQQHIVTGTVDESKRTGNWWHARSAIWLVSSSVPLDFAQSYVLRPHKKYTHICIHVSVSRTILISLASYCCYCYRHWEAGRLSLVVYRCMNEDVMKVR